MLDFEDFKACIAARGIALEMTENDFFEYKSKQSKANFTNYPYLDDIVVVQFRRGSTEMYWKTDMRVVEFSHGEFLQKKFIKAFSKEFFNPPPHAHKPCGKPCDFLVKIVDRGY